MRQLPTGTVTFLFTDIEGSTRLLQELGDGYAEVLIAHHEALRGAFVSHGGVEFGTEGDAFFVAFSRATDAAAAAIAGQQALAGQPVRVRMGIHTGEPQVVADDYVGIDVHRVARICAAGHGGQVVLSERTRPMLDGRFAVVDLGLHRLKDFDVGQRLFQLGGGKFPPLRTHNLVELPTPASHLIGREEELAAVAAALAERRVVTLTGAGGTGKTRLALEAAALVSEAFSDGVAWVPLETLDDASQVLPSIARALHAETAAAEAVGQRRMLLVLDNAERVLDAAADLASLLGLCPNVRLLVTSRAPLRISGEREMAVEPLADDAAVALFRERAVAAEPEDVVLEICRRLDGLPLAIELAAARTRVFSPPQLLERLSARLAVLTGGRRDLPERQRTLRGAIEWSHEVLPAEAQELFARLGVFSGGFELEAAEAVCRADVDVLETLVEGSLVRHREGRFTMLETIREFAVERFELLIDNAELRRAHSTWFLHLLDEAGPHLRGAAAGEWVPRLARELDNLWSGFGYAVETCVSDEALRYCAAFSGAWLPVPATEDVLRLKTKALELPDPPEGARPRVEALRATAMQLVILNRPSEAMAMVDEAIALARDVADDENLAIALTVKATAEHTIGRVEAALAALDAVGALEAAGRAKRTWFVPHVRGELLTTLGRHDEGVEAFEEAARLARDSQDVVSLAGTVHGRGDLELDRGDLDAAEERYLEALGAAAEFQLPRVIVYCLSGLACVALRRGDDTLGAALWAAVAAAEAELGPLMVADERARYEQIVGDAGPRHLEGPALTLDEAIQLVLQQAKSADGVADGEKGASARTAGVTTDTITT